MRACVFSVPRLRYRWWSATCDPQSAVVRCPEDTKIRRGVKYGSLHELYAVITRGQHGGDCCYDITIIL
jgi:hypothetical protein